jgi:uncharacterized membrane protein
MRRTRRSPQQSSFRAHLSAPSFRLPRAARGAQRGISLRFPSLSKRSLSRLRLFLYFATSLFLVTSLQAKELKIEKFQSQVAVLPDASVNITESIGVHFIGGPWHGLYRDIPVEYITPQQMNYSLFVTITRITDASGHDLKYQSSRVRHYLRLKIFVSDADNSYQTINIQYTVSDALRFFEEHDEFYWNITGDQWDVPIGDASATISLPVEAKNIRANVFTGAYRSTAKNAEAEVTGNGVEVHTTAPLGYHEGLTIAVAFDKGAVREPGALDKLALFFRSNWPLFLPILVFGFMFWLWWTRGRDPRLRPIAAQYQPPDKLTPSEAGTLVDDSCDMRDITAAIVDLAVRGYLVIQENTQEHMMGLWKDKDYNFILKKDRSTWTDLKPHEQALLDGIFDAGTVDETVSMSSLHNVFFRSLPIIKSQIFGSLISNGYYLHRPDTVRAGYIGGGLLFGFLAIAFGGAISANLGIAVVPVMIAGILSAAIICGFGWFMPARTETGTRALEGVLGFEDFLVHVESDRFNRMVKTPEMFEKFLPYAMALGVEKNWGKAFANIYTQPPQWYQGGNFSTGFYPYMFVSSLNNMSTQAATTFASAPRSSGGSGFSSGGGGGGGFSGGGFGGGGGGGF